MKIRFTIFFTLIILLSLTLNACGGSEPATPAEEQAPAAEEETAAEEPAEEMEPSVLDVGTTYIWDTANPAFGW